MSALSGLGSRGDKRFKSADVNLYRGPGVSSRRSAPGYHNDVIMPLPVIRRCRVVCPSVCLSVHDEVVSTVPYKLLR